jgi:hypothetical protein
VLTSGESKYTVQTTASAGAGTADTSWTMGICLDTGKSIIPQQSDINVNYNSANND